MKTPLLAGLLCAALGRATPLSAAEVVAGSVVSSKEWLVRRSPSREEEFIGSVRYKASGNEFTSDWALFKHETQQWRARGRVVVKHETANGDAVVGRGDESEYNQKTERGSVEAAEGKRVAFERLPAQGGAPDRGEADRLDWTGRRAASLTGQVHVWGPRLEGWADRFDFDGASGLVTLTGGRPVLVKGEGLGADWVGALKADTVTAERLARRVSAQGRVAGWLEFRSLPEVPR